MGHLPVGLSTAKCVSPLVARKSPRSDGPQDRVAGPLHDVEAVDADECLVLLARSAGFSHALSEIRWAALADGSSGGRPSSAAVAAHASRSQLSSSHRPIATRPTA
jgi:hypothetical protein